MGAAVKRIEKALKAQGRRITCLLLNTNTIYESPNGSGSESEAGVGEARSSVSSLTFATDQQSAAAPHSVGVDADGGVAEYNAESVDASGEATFGGSDNERTAATPMSGFTADISE